MMTWQEFVEAKAQLAPMDQQPDKYRGGTTNKAKLAPMDQQPQRYQGGSEQAVMVLRKPEGIFIKTRTGTIGPVETMDRQAPDHFLVNGETMVDLSRIPGKFRASLIQQFGQAGGDQMPRPDAPSLISKQTPPPSGGMTGRNPRNAKLGGNAAAWDKATRPE